MAVSASARGPQSRARIDRPLSRHWTWRMPASSTRKRTARAGKFLLARAAAWASGTTASRRSAKRRSSSWLSLPPTKFVAQPGQRAAGSASFANTGSGLRYLPDGQVSECGKALRWPGTATDDLTQPTATATGTSRRPRRSPPLRKPTPGRRPAGRSRPRAGTPRRSSPVRPSSPPPSAGGTSPSRATVPASSPVTGWRKRAASPMAAC